MSAILRNCVGGARALKKMDLHIAESERLCCEFKLYSRERERLFVVSAAVRTTCIFTKFFDIKQLRARASLNKGPYHLREIA